MFKIRSVCSSDETIFDAAEFHDDKLASFKGWDVQYLCEPKDPNFLDVTLGFERNRESFRAVRELADMVDWYESDDPSFTSKEVVDVVVGVGCWVMGIGRWQTADRHQFLT